MGVCLKAHQCASVMPFPDNKYGTGEGLQIAFATATRTALNWEWGKLSCNIPYLGLLKHCIVDS